MVVDHLSGIEGSAHVIIGQIGVREVYGRIRDFRLPGHVVQDQLARRTAPCGPGYDRLEALVAETAQTAGQGD